MSYKDSSAISRIEWTSGTLSVWFSETEHYDYSDVPKELYIKFLNAPYKGTFFNDFIREQYGD